MRIHNYGNDYAQAWKFKGVKDDRDRNTNNNEPTAPREVHPENTKDIETKEEGAKTKKGNKREKTNNSNNVQTNSPG